MNDTQNTTKKGERPTHSVSYNEGDEVVYIGSAWKHKKGAGYRIKLDKPGSLPSHVQYLNLFPRKEKEDPATGE